MKSKLLFSTLILSAAFSACTQEEVVVNNESVGSFDKVVGAKLVGNGFSVLPSDGIDSRIVKDEVTGKYVYSEGDKSGIAWVVLSGQSVSYDQTDVDLKDVHSTVFANHMLVHNGTSFESRGNVYEGWHFSYAPFNYMAKPQQITKVQVNPAFKGGYDDPDWAEIDWLVNAPQFSNATFVTTEGESKDVDLETGKITKSFPLQVVVNTIYPTLTPAADFKADNLKDIKVTSVTLSAGEKKLFTNEFDVVPSKLGEIVLNEETGKDETIINESYFDNAFTSEKETFVSVNVSEANINLGGEGGQIRMFLAPTADATGLKVDDLSLRVDVEGGYFLIDGVTASEENKAALEVIQEMLLGTYTKNEKIYDLTKLTQIRKGSDLGFDLLTKDFHTDFVIESYDQWVSCVNLANALGNDGETPVFTLKTGAEVVFDNDHKMIVPNREFSVEGEGTLVINGEQEWPTNITDDRLGSNVTVVVNEGSILRVDSKLLGSKQTLNKGTIKATANASINKNLINEGEIVVEVGTVISDGVSSENLGKISYRVPQNYDLNAINNLKEDGRVNTLVILEGHDLEYTSTLKTKYRLEILGGTVTVAEGHTCAASSVTLCGGSVSGLNIDNLTVKANEGNENTSYVNNVNVKYDLTVNKDVELVMTEGAIGDQLINNGTTTINAETCVQIVGNATNNGTLTANTDVFVNTIKLGNASKTTVATGKTIWYKSVDPKFEQNGDTKGSIKLYGGFANALEAAKDGDVVVLTQNETLTDMSFVEKEIIIKGANKDVELKLDFGSNQIKFDAPVQFENITIDPVTTYDDSKSTDYEKYVLFENDVVLKNVVVKNNVGVAGNATFENVTFEGDNTNTYALWVAPFGKTINVEGCTFNSERAISILGGFKDAYGMTTDVKETEDTKLKVSATTFDTNYKTAIMAGAAVNVTWGEGNSLIGNEDKNYPVYIRKEFYENDGNNIKKVVVTGCEVYCEK